MGEDLIKRSDAIAEIYKVRTPDVASHHYAELFINAVHRVPSADRPQGEWIYKDDDVFAGEYTCSFCNRRAEVDLYGQWILSNYCPSCGAHMKGADDE